MQIPPNETTGEPLTRQPWTMRREIIGTLIGMAPYFVTGGTLLVNYLGDIKQSISDVKTQVALQKQAIEFLQLQRSETNTRIDQDRSETRKQIDIINGQLTAISSALGVNKR